jgi:alkyl hydroperoxide reductase subunit AhpC
MGEGIGAVCGEERESGFFEGPDISVTGGSEMSVKNLSQNFRPARAKSVLIAAALMVGILVPTGAQAILGIGEPAPSFSLVAGNNKKLSLDMLKGKVVVLFYATRDTVEVNDALSHYLDALYAAQPQNIQSQIYRLLVVNAMEATAVTTWKEKLNETSAKLKVTVYGDWTGGMFSAYRMRDNDSNFVIIDKKGVVRFAASGKIPNSRFEAIKKLLLELATGK